MFTFLLLHWIRPDEFLLTEPAVAVPLLAVVVMFTNQRAQRCFGVRPLVVYDNIQDPDERNLSVD